MREELIKEVTTFRAETGLSETYLGKKAGVGTGFFDSVRAGTASVNSIDKFRKFVGEWRAENPSSGVPSQAAQ